MGRTTSGDADASPGHASSVQGIALSITDRKAGDNFQAQLSSGGQGPEMIVVPGGRFRMGDLSGAGDTDEKPVHEVRIEQFAVGRYEITKDQYGTFVSASGYRTDAENNAGGNEGCYAYQGGTDFGWTTGTSWRNPGFSQAGSEPVVCISWNDAKAYVTWLGRETGKRYRLLSESEWEYVARAGSKSKFSWGNDDNGGCRHANGADQSAKSRFSGWTVSECTDGHIFTAPVGSFKANAFGLFDVHGNVWEWTQDCWNDSYNGAPNNGSAWQRGDCDRRVLRGGSWDDKPELLRSANRDWTATAFRDCSSGFRVAQDL